MEDNKLQIGAEDIKKLKMTSLEKKMVFDRILNSSATIEAPKSIKSPWFGLSLMARISTSRLTYYLVIPLIIILGSGGFVFASEASLPDSVFYPIKVDIVEPVIGVFAFTQEAKAEYQSNLATKRLVEAETLAKQGKLDSIKEKKLSNLLATHTSALNKAIDSINNEDQSYEQVDEIVTNFKAGMNAHARILDIITEGQKKNDNQDNKNLDTKISNKAREHAVKIKNNFKDKEIKNPADKYAKRKKAVDSLIKSTTTDLDNIDTTTASETTVSDTNKTLDEAKQFLNEANIQELKGESDNAYRALLNSESAAKEAGIFIRAELRARDDRGR